jgi:hypothetical protein
VHALSFVTSLLTEGAFLICLCLLRKGIALQRSIYICLSIHRRAARSLLGSQARRQASPLISSRNGKPCSR